MFPNGTRIDSCEVGQILHCHESVAAHGSSELGYRPIRSDTVGISRHGMGRTKVSVNVPRLFYGLFFDDNLLR